MGSVEDKIQQKKLHLSQAGDNLSLFDGKFHFESKQLSKDHKPVIWGNLRVLTELG